MQVFWRRSAVSRDRQLRVGSALLTASLVVGWPSPGTDAAQSVALCTIESSGIEFGIYDPRDPVPLDAIGGITYTCSTKIVVAIAMTAGVSGSFDRTLAGGADRLSYNLYLDSARTKVWGDGALGTATYVDLDPPKDAAVGVPVYGRIPARQSVAEGRYTDNLMVVMIF